MWRGTCCCGYHLYTFGVVFSLHWLLWCCLRRRGRLTVETESDATVWTAGRCLTSKKCVWKYLNVFVSSVEPPTNVTFRCHNLEDLLQWSYEPWVEGLRFRVNILSLQRSSAERPTRMLFGDGEVLRWRVWCVSDLQPSCRAVGGSTGSSGQPFAPHKPSWRQLCECDCRRWKERIRRGSRRWNPVQLRQGVSGDTQMWAVGGEN